MSGGSFDYFYIREPYQILEDIEPVKRMADKFTEYGFHDVAKDLYAYHLYLQTIINRIEAYQKRMEPILHGLEWECSGDYGMDQLKEIVEEYRTEMKA